MSLTADRFGRTGKVIAARRSTCHLLSLLTALLASSCSDSNVSSPQLVLLYAPCSVNKDFLSPWNDSRTFTPNLAKFATSSMVFARHQTESGQSGISYASIFTGSQADHHQIYRHPARLSDRLYLITEAYVDAGYETFFWGGHPMASGSLNYAQGVDAANIFKKRLSADDPRFEKILEKLSRDPEYRVFIVTNFSVTHGPYEKLRVDRFMAEYPAEVLDVTPADIEKYADRYRDDVFGLTWNHAATLEKLEIRDDLPKFVNVIEVLYRSNVNYLDRLFGDVLDQITRMGLLDESLIVFTADHGEVLYRDSATFKWTHSMLLDHEVLGIPLVIHSPRISSGTAQYSGVTRSKDIFPTMLGLSGIRPLVDRNIQGIDLSETLTRGTPAPELLAYSHTTVLSKMVFEQMYDRTHRKDWLGARRFFPNARIDHIWVAVRAGDEWFKHRKLMDGSWVTQVFDLATDPEANHNSFDPSNARHAVMRDGLWAYKAMLVQNYNRKGGAAREDSLPSDLEAELLRDLGYIQ